MVTDAFCGRWSLAVQVVLDVYSILVFKMAQVQFTDFLDFNVSLRFVYLLPERN